jgi:hypothetical protein
MMSHPVNFSLKKLLITRGKNNQHDEKDTKNWQDNTETFLVLYVFPAFFDKLVIIFFVFPQWYSKKFIHPLTLLDIGLAAFKQSKY